MACTNEDPISDFIDLHNDDGPLDYPQAGEGIINTGLADDLELAVGDDITVYDSEQHELTVTISGICDNYVYNYLYINDDTYVENYDEMNVNSAFVIAPKNDGGEIANAGQVSEELMEASHAVSYTHLPANLRQMPALWPPPPSVPST